MNRLHTNLKIFFLIKIFIIFIIIPFKSYGENTVTQKNTVVLGPDHAIVKIKIFSSLTCPHCANFHIKVVPEIIEQYVKLGKVQLIFIDFPLDEAAFNASKLLHCVEKNKQMKFLDLIYKNQSDWANSSNINDINNNLRKIVKNLGISSLKFDKCLVDEVISDKILNDRIDAGIKYSINSTPSIIINEKKLEGSISFKNIKKKIEKII